MARKFTLIILLTMLTTTTWALAWNNDQDLILAVQVRLQEEGFDPGPHDGLMGPRTSAALLRFQSENDLEPTGKIDDDTLLALGLKEKGLWGKVTDVAETSASAVAGAAKTTAKATAKATKKGAKEAAHATRTAAEVTAEKTTEVAKELDETVTGSTNKEAVLVAKVESELEADPRIKASNIEVSSEGEGIIRLSFRGGTDRDWNLAIAKTRSVEGVKEVFVRLPAQESSR